ncbi:MAG TPA: amidase family protein [Methylomirabilota bacterium]|jgi:Asp-tRNA(Asn)/Glu-tRNA(Gln) amidotransferase A subunit family amidase|nr:amidase family protein [Methylomirabilota bacterium]
MNATDLCYTPATELGRLIRSRKLSPVELTDGVLARIERLNPKLNAFLTVTADHARELARAAEARVQRGTLIGPLDGIPYSIKDLEPTAGIRTTYGSKFFEENVPSEDGIVAARLRATGGVLLGKTNTPHFGYKDMCDNLIGPPCRNPWNLGRTSGASSGGAGAAVAAGLGPIAHGSDGSGSIRIPSALCGIFGMKPSLGRVPYWPSADLWNTRSHNGPMTRTVRDAALLLQAMAGPDPRDPMSIDAPPADYLAACEGDLKGMRVGWSRDLGFAAVDPEVGEIAASAARRFADLGCEVEEAKIDWGNPYEFHKVIYSVHVAARNHERARARPDWIEPTLMRMILDAAKLSAIDFVQAWLARTVFAERVRATFERYDLLLTPQMPVAAWPADPGPFEGLPDLGGKPAHSIFDRVPFMYPFNLTGQPAANAPCGFTRERLPVGLQIVGRWHRETDVFRAAACFEALQPWASHRPPLD